MKNKTHLRHIGFFTEDLISKFFYSSLYEDKQKPFSPKHSHNFSNTQSSTINPLSNTNNRGGGLGKLNKNIGQEYKKQFNSKQSFKKLYSNNNFSFFQSNTKPLNSRFNKNNILQEGYFRKLTELNRHLHIIPLIETRLDILACRLGWAKNLNEAQHLIRTNKIKINSVNNAYLNNKKFSFNKKFHQFFIPIGSVIEKEIDSKIIRQNNLNFLLINTVQHNYFDNIKGLNNIAPSDSKWTEKVTLIRYPLEKEIFKLWIEENNLNKKLLVNIMLQIDKLNLQT